MFIVLNIVNYTLKYVKKIITERGWIKYDYDNL